MTWVIGAAPELGAIGAVLSDIQVTLGDRTFDILRKAYPVGPDMIGGFAGSVGIGFQLLRSCVQFLTLPGDAPPNSAFRPPDVAEHWAPIARAIFDGSSDAQRELGAQFILVGPHPIDDGIPGRAIVYVCKFSYPDFEPQIIRQRGALSIGSGSGVAEYTGALEEVLSPTSGLIQTEIGAPGHWARMLGFAINQVLSRYPVIGISQHIHVQAVGRDGYGLTTSDCKQTRSDGTVHQFCMPAVAESYEQLEHMLDELGADVATAKA